jgi:hypothetical protein
LRSIKVIQKCLITTSAALNTDLIEMITADEEDDGEIS